MAEQVWIEFDVDVACTLNKRIAYFLFCKN